MFIFIWAPCHAWFSLWKVIKMTPTNCKCLQKRSLASSGQSSEIKGHVCPSICLFVCLFLVFIFSFFFSNRLWGTCHRIEYVQCILWGIFFNQGSGFIYISSSLNHSGWDLDGKMPVQFILAAQGAQLFSHSVAEWQLLTISFQSVFNRNTRANLCLCQARVEWSHTFIYCHFLTIPVY